MVNIRLILQYDGSRFVGWQLQPGQRTVQGVLEQAISTFLGGEDVRVVAAGRTDSGVHARAQVVCFRTARDRSLRSWLLGLNRILPEDLAVQEVDLVPDDFDPRRWALGKRYVYRIWNGRTRSPLARLTSWDVFQPLDVEVMREAASHFVGEHDFAAFRAAGCAAETTTRVVERLDVDGEAGGEVSIDIRATAFLRHMVRNIAGTLVEVGLGRRNSVEIPMLLKSRDRSMTGRTAPAHGLTLEEVYYGLEPPRRRRMDGSTGSGGER